MSAYDDFKAMKKQAFPAPTPPSFMGSVSSAAGKLPGAIVSGIGATAATAAVTGLGFAAQKIYDAMTKRHDFNSMLEMNPDLAEHHVNSPKMFNQMFSTLRTMNPGFSKDPMVAGTYMRRMMESPLHAGGIAVEAFGQSRGPQGLLATSAQESGPVARSPFSKGRGRQDQDQQ